MALTHVDLLEKLPHYNRVPCLFVLGVIQDAEDADSFFCSYGANKRQDKRVNILFGFKYITGDYTLSPDALCMCYYSPQDPFSKTVIHPAQLLYQRATD